MQISMSSIRYTRKEMDGMYKTSKPKSKINQVESNHLVHIPLYSYALHYLLSPHSSALYVYVCALFAFLFFFVCLFLLFYFILVH